MFLNVVLLGPDTERMLRVCRMYKNGISVPSLPCSIALNRKILCSSAKSKACLPGLPLQPTLEIFLSFTLFRGIQFLIKDVLKYIKEIHTHLRDTYTHSTTLLDLPGLPLYLSVISFNLLSVVQGFKRLSWFKYSFSFLSSISLWKKEWPSS